MEPRKALALAKQLVADHGLDQFGWKAVLDTRAVTRAGQCRYSVKEIGISYRWVAMNDEKHVRNTILHEIAHALVGAEHGHDWVWKQKARQIGCTGDRCTSPEAKKVPGKYRAVCPNCGHVHYRHRASKRMNDYACAAPGCYGPKMQRALTFSQVG